MSHKTLTGVAAARGIRNNNPGNIERNSIRWNGMALEQTDPRFVVFTRPEYGIRALAKVLLTYQRRYGLDTVAKIIGRWAPPVENDTGAYAQHVAAQVGVGVYDRIDLSNGMVLTGLITAIIAHENGNYSYPQPIIQAGINLALERILEA